MYASTSEIRKGERPNETPKVSHETGPYANHLQQPCGITRLSALGGPRCALDSYIGVFRRPRTRVRSGGAGAPRLARWRSVMPVSHLWPPRCPICNHCQRSLAKTRGGELGAPFRARSHRTRPRSGETGPAEDARDAWCRSRRRRARNRGAHAWMGGASSRLGSRECSLGAARAAGSPNSWEGEASLQGCLTTPHCASIVGRVASEHSGWLRSPKYATPSEIAARSYSIGHSLSP